MYESTSAVYRDFYAHFKTFSQKKKTKIISKTYIRVFTTFTTLKKKTSYLRKQKALSSHYWIPDKHRGSTLRAPRYSVE